MITISLIDSQLLFRDGFRGLLAKEDDFSVVSEGDNNAQGIDAVRAQNPDLVIFDLLPGVGALQLARDLLRDRPGCCLMALTASMDDQSRIDALGIGVLGYASKRQGTADVVAAIRRVAGGDSYLCPLFVGRPLGSPLSGLSLREREVFDLTVEGLGSAEVGHLLRISPRTVETHRAKIQHKLRVHSTIDLVRLAARLGLLQE
jgi:two-component system response regulator NreC